MLSDQSQSMVDFGKHNRQPWFPKLRVP
jgi:hypothetical protein